jgi:hypothetical protein
MKTTFFVLLILCAATAFGQAAGGGISNNPQMLYLSENPKHADLHDMAKETPLVGGRADNYTYAQGERPLWEFGPVTEPIPLGDVARAYRQQKAAAKKAEFIFEKQGS